MFTDTVKWNILQIEHSHVNNAVFSFRYVDDLTGKDLPPKHMKIGD